MPRNPASSAQPNSFGLLAWLEETRISLPLKGVECRFQVCGDVVGVELDQIYHLDADRPLDCVYGFPLPEGASVYRCEIHLPERVLRARVQEREAARREFQERRAEGRRAALVEVERDNYFTLSLGNLQPGDVAVVRLAWFQVLERTGEERRLRVPLCPGVRYIPGVPLLRANTGLGTVNDTDQVPDASRITPPRIDALHRDAAFFSVGGTIAAGDVLSGSASSPSHCLCVREGSETVEIALSSEGDVPDRDFILSWREPEARQLQPLGWSWTEGTETWALVQLRAPREIAPVAGLRQDFYFLVDRSGSMAGPKWVRTCQALIAFVRLLGKEDRVWVTLFESSYRDFAEAPMPRDQVLSDRGFLALANLGADGGTELLPAAEHVLQAIDRHSEGRRANVILITDGQVGNEDASIRAFARHPAVLVHTFGIDTAVNDAFLRQLARQQRGRCWVQTPNDDIVGTVAALGDQLQRPVLTDLSLAEGWEAASPIVPELHAREVVSLAVRGSGPGPVELRGSLQGQPGHLLRVDIARPGSQAIQLVWIRDRIAALLKSGQRSEALALAVQHNILCRGAAFVAWDEAEQVPVAAETLIQPSLEPREAFLLAFEQTVTSRRRSLGAADPLGPIDRAACDVHCTRRFQSAPSPIWQGLGGLDLDGPQHQAFCDWLMAHPDRFSEATAMKTRAATIRRRLLASAAAWPVALTWEPLLRETVSRDPIGAEKLCAALEAFLDLWDFLRQAGAPMEQARQALERCVLAEGIESEQLGKLRQLLAAGPAPSGRFKRRRYWRETLAILVPADLRQAPKVPSALPKKGSSLWKILRKSVSQSVNPRE